MYPIAKSVCRIYYANVKCGITSSFVHIAVVIWQQGYFISNRGMEMKQGRSQYRI